MRQDGRAEFISASLSHDEEADELKVVEARNIVSQGACSARREEAVDIALLLYVDDGVDCIVQQCRDGVHITPIIGLAVERLVYCSDGLFFPTAEEADIVEDLLRILIVAEYCPILPDVDHVEGVNAVACINA